MFCLRLSALVVWIWWAEATCQVCHTLELELINVYQDRQTGRGRTCLQHVLCEEYLIRARYQKFRLPAAS